MQVNSAINIDIGGNKILQTISKKPYALKKIDKFKYIKIKKMNTKNTLTNWE